MIFFNSISSAVYRCSSNTFSQCALIGDPQGIGLGHRYIRLHANALPVGFTGWVNGAQTGDEGLKVAGDGIAQARMSAAACGLTDHSGAL